MGWKKTTAEAIADAVARTGQKVAGDKGVQAANRITGPLLGRTYEKCSDTACGNCNNHS